MNLTGQPVRQRVPQFVAPEWRNSARGKPCAVQLPGVCNRNPETTVLCHLRMFGNAGTGQKPHDFLAVYACSACHDAIDRRGMKTGVDPLDLLRALMLTLTTHYEEGRLK